MALVFDKPTRVITVEKTQKELTIQDLHDECRLFEEKNQNLEVAQIAAASGKQDLGGGVSVGITLELINDWRLAFEARTDQDVIDEGFPAGGVVLCFVRGGNLVAYKETGEQQNPIYPTENTQVVIAQSSSATIATPPSDSGLLHMVESLRDRSASVGDIWYWDPASGDDGSDGTTPATAVATFAQAQTLASTGRSDNIIFALATAGGLTQTTEKITISTPNIKLRGPGYTFQFAPDSAGAPTVSITAANVEFSGFYVTTFAGGTDNGITVTGDNALVKDVWVTTTTANGIDISSSSRSTVETCAIEDCAADGIAVGGSTTIAKVARCIISGNGDAGVELTGGATTTDNVLENNLIFNNTGDCIHINASVARTMVRLHHTFSGNGDDVPNDEGSGSYIETPAGGESASTIADAVWNELISDHVSAGSAGKTLRDAKVKATLASLK